MKAIERRLRQLEHVPSPQESEAEKTASAILAERGIKPSPPGSYSGCRTIADHILRARELSQERERLESATRATMTK